MAEARNNAYSTAFIRKSDNDNDNITSLILVNNALFHIILEHI